MLSNNHIDCQAKLLNTTHDLLVTASIFHHHREIVYTFLCSLQYNHLVDVEGLDLIIRLPELLVLAHEDNLGDPCEHKCHDREGSGGAERNDVAGLIGLGPEVRSPATNVNAVRQV